MKKLLKNPTVRDHVVPTLIVFSWFVIISIIALIVSK